MLELLKSIWLRSSATLVAPMRRYDAALDWTWEHIGNAAGTSIQKFRPFRGPATRCGRALLLAAVVLPPILGITQSIANSRVGNSLLLLTLTFIIVIGWAGLDGVGEVFLSAVALVLALVVAMVVINGSSSFAPLLYAPLVTGLLAPRLKASWRRILAIASGLFAGWYAQFLFQPGWHYAIMTSLPFVTTFVGGHVTVKTTQARRDLARTWQYLAVMRGAMVLLAAVYLGVILIFAGWYQLLYHQLSPGSFSGTPSFPSYWDFVYLSLMTISTVGYSTIRPVDGPARIATSVEVVLGIALTVVVFAALISYFSPQFALLARKFRADDALHKLAGIESDYAEGSEADEAKALEGLDLIRRLVRSKRLLRESASDEARSSLEWFVGLSDLERRVVASGVQETLDEWDL